MLIVPQFLTAENQNDPKGAFSVVSVISVVKNSRNVKLRLRRGAVVVGEGVFAHLLQELREGADLLGKEAPFGRRDPFEAEVLFIDSEELQDFPRILHHLLTLYITSQVMAVTDVSAGHHHAVRSRLEGVEQEAVVDPSGTHEADEPDVGGVLHAGHPGQVRSGVGAPVAHKSDDLRFIRFGHFQAPDS